jgi:hypothetical protein
MSWYEVIEGTSLLQGDILQCCPIVTVVGSLTWPVSEETEIGIEVTSSDVIVVSQSCDLQNDKVKEVLLAQVISWEEVVAAEMAVGNQARVGCIGEASYTQNHSLLT